MSHVPSPARPWLLLQLIDGAFPSGSFAHSGGLEAALHFRGVKAELDVAAFSDEVLWNVGRGALPFVRRACEAPSDLAELDALFDATSTSHVANRASRAQGRALASAARVIFPRDDVERIAKHARERSAHHAPVFGALVGTLGIDAHDACVAYLHGARRGVLSAAVRLGAVGPLEAQQLQAEGAATLERILEACMSLDVDDVAQASPLVELFGALHERLDGRLFQS